MKKILPFLFFLVVASQLQAQYKPVVLGLRVGTNIGWIKSNTEDYNSEGIKMGFAWGFISEFYLMENYAIGTGFSMNFNGGKLEYPWQEEVNTGNGTSTVSGRLHRNYNLKYIQIPLFLKMKTELSDKITAFGKIGIGTAFCLNAKSDDEFNYEGGDVTDSKVDINDEISLMRESLIIGGGVEYKINESTAVIVDITYDNAFNNLFSGDFSSVSGAKALHNYVELGIGIVF